MKTNLTARNLELTDRLRAAIERKLRRLDRIAHPETEASVELIANASHMVEASHVVEVTLVTNGAVVRSTSSAATPLAAFDAVLDKVERQVVRSKKRARRVRERASDEVVDALARAGVATGAEEPAAADAVASVVKMKRFAMPPMFEEDAITRMEELGHAFFVFHNAETDEVAVVYRRKDGSYGVIDPVLDRGKERH
ncbi:MAG: ribosome hibernation-promoting factor, HPF/YfiA family [Candidatus Limnocylindria bacterium]